MIGLLFNHYKDLVEVRISGTNLLFRSSEYGSAFVSIDSLQLSYEGVLREHPDLKDKKDWRQQAINRLKEHLKKMKNDNERAEYIIKDLQKHGYVLYAKQKQGHRIEKL